MSTAGNEHGSRNELFDAVEKRGKRRLDAIVPDGVLDSAPEEIPVPPGLAERTCRRLWSAVDRGEAVFSTDMSRAPRQTASLIPKYPRYERSSKKSAPFIIKKMAITEEPLPSKPAPMITALEAAPAARTPLVETPALAEPFVPAPILETPPVDEPLLETPAAKPTAPKSVSLEVLKRQFAKESFKPRGRRKNRCPLLNGQIRPEAQDEYYWEILPPETVSEKKRRTRLESSAALVPSEQEEENRLVESVSEIGRTTLHYIDSARGWLGVKSPRTSPPEEMNRPIRGKRRGKPSDMLISIVAGILIATTVVFPTLKFVGREFVMVIAKTAVRKIGQKIQITSDHSSADLIPFYTEQILFPQSQEVEFLPKEIEEAENIPFIPMNPDADPAEHYLPVSEDGQ